MKTRGTASRIGLYVNRPLSSEAHGDRFARQQATALSSFK